MRTRPNRRAAECCLGYLVAYVFVVPLTGRYVASDFVLSGTAHFLTLWGGVAAGRLSSLHWALTCGGKRAGATVSDRAASQTCLAREETCETFMTAPRTC
jgi:hypothetical protein